MGGPRGPGGPGGGPRWGGPGGGSGHMMGMMGQRPIIIPDGMSNTPPRAMMPPGGGNLRMGGPHLMDESGMQGPGMMRPINDPQHQHMMQQQQQQGMNNMSPVPGGQMFMRNNAPMGTCTQFSRCIGG